MGTHHRGSTPTGIASKLDHRARKRGRGLRASCLAAITIVSGINIRATLAVDQYWDINGTTSGAGGATPGGNWTGNNWSTSSLGTVATGAWVAGNTAVFAAGSDATGAYTVTLSGTQSVAGITIEQGSVTLTGGTLSFTGADNINNGLSQPLVINSAIIGTAGLTHSGSGKLTLGGVNTFTGTITNSAGLISIDSNSRLGNVANALVFSGGGLETTTSMSIARSITLNGNPGFEPNAGTTLTLSGLISGTGGIFSSGPGTLRLTNTSNSYSGVTNLSDGILNISSDSVLGAVPAAPTTNLNFTLGDATLQFGASFNLATNRSIAISTLGGAIIDTNGFNTTISGVISGSGSNGFTKAGAGKLTLTGTSNTFSGGTTINSGTLAVLADSNLGGIANDIVFGGGTLNTTASFATARDVIINASSGAFEVASATTLTATGVISGTGGLAKTGSGTLVLTNTNNSYSGASIVSVGAVMLGASNVLPNSAAIDISGGTLDIGANSDTVGAVTLTSGSITGTGGVLSGSSYSVQSGSISAALGGAGALTKTTSAAVTLSGPNSYSGPTTINGGTLVINSNASLGNATGAVNINGATLAAVSSVTTTRTFTVGAGGATFSSSPGTTLTIVGATTMGGSGPVTINGGAVDLFPNTSNTFIGNVSVNAAQLQIGSDGALGNAANDLTLDGATLTNSGGVSLNSGRSVTLGGSGATVQTLNDLTIAGAISGGGELIKSGSADLVLSGVNNYSGNTTVTAGKLRIENAAGLGATPSVSVASGASLEAGGVTLDKPLALNGGLRGTGAAGFDGTITVPSAAAVFLGTTAAGDELTLGNQTNDLTGGGGGSSILVSGPGTVALTQSSDYSGRWTINGQLRISADNQLGNAANNILLGTGTLLTTSSFASGRTVTLNPAGAISPAASTTFTLSSDLKGGGSLSKQGAGTLILQAASTRSALTDIAGGVLRIENGSALGTGNMSVSSGAVLELGGVTLNQTCTLTNGATLRGTAAAGSNSPVIVPSAAAVTLASGANPGDVLTIGNSTNDLTGGGGGSSITTAGSGKVVLSQSSDYVGSWIIAGGTLEAGADARLGNAANTINLGGGTFSASSGFSTARTVVAGGGAIGVPTFGQTLSVSSGLGAGSASLTKTGQGTLTLLAGSSRTGVTNINGGTIRAATATALGTGASAVNLSGGSLEIASLSFAKPLNTVSSSNTLNFSGNSTYTGTITVSSGGSLALRDAGPADVLVLGDAADDLAGPSGAVLFLGSGNGGTIVVPFSNSYSGIVSVDSLVRLQHPNGLGTGSPSVSGTLQLESLNFSNNLGFLGGTLKGVGNSTFSGSCPVSNTSTTLATSNSASDIFTIGTGAANAVTGGGTSATMTVSGAGTIVLTGSNSYQGAWLLTGGTLELSADNRLGISTNPVTLAAGTFAATGTFSTSRFVTFAGGTFSVASGSTVTIPSASQLDVGSGPIIKSGPGTLVIGAGTSTRSGSVFVNAGTLQINNSQVLGNNLITVAAGASMLVGNGTGTAFTGTGITNNGSLTYNNIANYTFTGAISGTGTVTKLGTNTITLTGGNTNTGAKTISAGALQIGNGGTTGSIAGNIDIAAPASLAFNRSNSLTFAGNLSGAGTLNKLGAGTLVLSGTNSSTGTTNVNAGVVTFNNSFRTGATLNIADGAKAALAPRGGGAARVLQTGVLNLNSTGTLDAADNDLVVDSGAYTQILSQVLSGFGNTSGGIVSSTSDGSQILALFDNALVGAGDWNGVAISPNAVVGKYTYFGDANIDGQVTGDDYTVIDANLNTTPAVGLGWLSGDMNLDGTVTGDDYTVIDANLGLGSGNPLTPSQLVPEPALLPVAALAVLFRRRRRWG